MNRQRTSNLSEKTMFAIQSGGAHHLGTSVSLLA
jgi:hypothetical protein